MMCRLAAAYKREKYEARHMGNFRRIYPSSSAPLQAKYEWLLQGSARLFASSLKSKAHNTIGRIQVRIATTAPIAQAHTDHLGSVNRSLLQCYQMACAQAALARRTTLLAGHRCGSAVNPSCKVLPISMHCVTQ